MLSRKYPTTTKTTRMGKRGHNKRDKGEQRGVRNTKPLTTHRKGETNTRRGTKRKHKKDTKRNKL